MARYALGGQYTRAQYIAYEMCTKPGGFETRWTADDDRYIGLSEIPADVRARVMLFKEALAAAHSQPSVDRDPRTLKVFMAPEFYFRGPEGAYQLEQVFGKADQGGLLRTLTDLVAGPQWEHWVVCFGTVIGYSKLPGADGHGGRKDWECYNMAALQLGGFTSDAQRKRGCRLVVKLLKSGIDFLKTPQLGMGDHDIRHPYWSRRENGHIPGRAPGDDLDFWGGQRLDGDRIDDDGVFELGGVLFGLEICLDHLCKRIRDSPPDGDLAGWQPQIHLVPSGGMTVQVTSLCTQRDGLVFHCDGLTNRSRRYGAHSSAYRVPFACPQPRRGDAHVASDAEAEWARGGGADDDNDGLKERCLDPVPVAQRVAPHGSGAQWQARLRDVFETKGVAAPQITVYKPQLLPVPVCDAPAPTLAAGERGMPSPAPAAPPAAASRAAGTAAPSRGVAPPDAQAPPPRQQLQPRVPTPEELAESLRQAQEDAARSPRVQQQLQQAQAARQPASRHGYGGTPSQRTGH